MHFQDSFGSYLMHLYEHNNNIIVNDCVATVTLSGSSTNTFRGFIVKAHVPGQDQMLLGQFIPQANQRTLDCDNVGAANAATVAHSNSARTNFQSMTFTWQAPSGADRTVDFRYEAA